MATRASLDSRGLRPPPLQTNFQRPTTAPPPSGSTASTSSKDTGPPAYSTTTSSHANGDSVMSRGAGSSQLSPIPQGQPQQGHQRFVLTDPLAFKYLEEDPNTTVLERRRELEGYECYIVEQWSTSRSHPTSTITTYTGDPSHTIIVGVLSVPTDEASWSPRLRVYFKALNQYHARRRDTPLGVLMVTNLSGFPSSLTVIPLPDGDLKKHRYDFNVNENLKRLGCSGRVGLNLAAPSAATIAKFHQLYRTSEKNDVYKSVVEIVRLCQSALLLFDKLEIDYADGLLCDVTERAVNDWWLDMGSEYYSIEPHDGILGPTTVAGLLGLMIGARNRLHAVGSPVAKDPFDVMAMKRGISAFQKQHRLPRTRRLDRRTLDRLQRATMKAANSEGWNVPKAVKSTVAELSGRGGEMVMDAVGRRDRAGIAEIETTDIDRFVQLVYGERCKWLWYGRPMKKSARISSGGAPVAEDRPALHRDLTFRQDEHGGFTWTARKSVGDGLMMRGLGEDNDLASPVVQDEDDEDKIKGVLKRPSGLKEAKSGLGRFRGAVGLGGHQRQQSKNESPQSPQSPQSPSNEYLSRPGFRRSQSSPITTPTSPKSPADRAFDRSIGPHQREGTIPEDEGDVAPAYAASERQEVPRGSREGLAPPSYSSTREKQNGDDASDAGYETDSRTIEPSVAGSVYNGVELNEQLPDGPETEHDVGRLMQRTTSYSHFESTLQSKADDGYARHLSFSLAESSLLTWDPVTGDVDEDEEDLQQRMIDQRYLADHYRGLRHNIKTLELQTTPFTTSSLLSLTTLITKLEEDAHTLEASYDPHREARDGLQTAAESVLRSERDALEEGSKEIETLAAKLEYEISGLKAKVEDVEQGVRDFEAGVGRCEDRVMELEKEGAKDDQGWGCILM